VTCRAWRIAGGVCLAVTATTAPASGQTAAPRPVTAIYGGSSYEPGPKHLFDATLGIGAAYENNETAEFEQAFLSPFERTGPYTSASGSLAYNWRGEKAQFGANGGAEGRIYQQSGEVLSVNRYAGVGLVANFARRTQIVLNQTVSYSPAYFSGMFPVLSDQRPGAINALGPNHAVSTLNALTYDTSGDISHGLTPRTTVSFSSSVRRTDFPEGSGYEDLLAYSIGGRADRHLSENTTVRFGYYYRKGQYAFVADAPVNAAVHDLDVGIIYDRALSLTRRTHLDFSVGSSLINQPVGAGTAPDPVDDRLQYEFTGSVGLNHEFRQTWLARLAYDRGAGLVEGFPEPVFSNGVSASLDGFMNPRAELSLRAAYTNGDVGSLATGNGLKAYSASAQLQYGINRFMATSGEYFYYWYEIGPNVALPAGVTPFRERFGVRGWLTVWLPLVRR
jgi:hypothetical protein